MDKDLSRVLVGRGVFAADVQCVQLIDTGTDKLDRFLSDLEDLMRAVPYSSSRDRERDSRRISRIRRSVELLREEMRDFRTNFPK
jgi:hypothetical protein